MDGLLLVDKETHVTSREIDNQIKKRFDERGVGHLGTLDPFASGLLIVGLGQGTKLFPFMDEEKKTYMATLQLGEKRDTGELNGNILAQKAIPELNEEKIRATFQGFLGKSMQVPPRFSAKHIQGQRAYDLARSGESFELKPNPIEIFALDLNSFDKNKGLFVFTATVSKGTYIRTLGEDLAEKLGTLGYLVALRRTKIGRFDVSKAKKLSELKKNDILPLSQSLDIPSLVVLGNRKDEVRTGRDLFLSDQKAPLLQILDESNHLLAIYEEKSAGVYHCKRGFKISF